LKTKISNLTEEKSTKPNAKLYLEKINFQNQHRNLKHEFCLKKPKRRSPSNLEKHFPKRFVQKPTSTNNISSYIRNINRRYLLNIYIEKTDLVQNSTWTSDI